MAEPLRQASDDMHAQSVRVLPYGERVGRVANHLGLVDKPLSCLCEEQSDEAISLCPNDRDCRATLAMTGIRLFQPAIYGEETK